MSRQEKANLRTSKSAPSFTTQNTFIFFVLEGVFSILKMQASRVLQILYCSWHLGRKRRRAASRLFKAGLGNTFITPRFRAGRSGFGAWGPYSSGEMSGTVAEIF